MRVFVTGASGWIGSATVGQLLAHDHDVVGLARSDASAAALEAMGAVVRRGDLDDLDSLRAGAGDADAVVHLANKHDFTDPAVSNRAERAAVETFVEALAGSDRPLVVASGLAIPVEGQRLPVETDPSPFHGPDSMRGGAENLVLESAARGLRPIAVRFAPTVHGAGDHGFVRVLSDVARGRGEASYVGDGSTRWGAVHVSDAAVLVRLALEQATPEPTVVHAVAESGVPSREIAEGIGRGLGVPVTALDPDAAVEQLGWIGRFFGMDLAGSSEATQERLGWRPTGPTLAEDLATGSYFQ